MTLAELRPRWIADGVLAFLCPHCREWWLICKNRPLSNGEQFDLLEKAFGDDWNMMAVPARDDYAWQIAGSLPMLTVRPSIDASHSGHWHGNITDGNITG